MRGTISLISGAMALVAIFSLAGCAMLQSSTAEQVVFIGGRIEDESVIRLAAAIDRGERPVVHFRSSPGGSAFASKGLRFLIQRNQLETRFSGACISACAVAFLAGKTRFFDSRGEGGGLGLLYFHSATLNGDFRSSRDLAEAVVADTAGSFPTDLALDIFVRDLGMELMIAFDKNGSESSVCVRRVGRSGRDCSSSPLTGEILGIGVR